MNRYIGLGLVFAAGCTPTLPVELQPQVAPAPWVESPVLVPIVSAPPPPKADAGPGVSTASLTEEMNTWFLAINGEAFTLRLPTTDLATGALTDSAGQAQPVTDVIGADASGWVRFRSVHHGRTAWFRVRIREGVLAGRWALSETLPLVPALFPGHVTGWNRGAFERVPARVYRLEFAQGDLVTLRLDGLVDEGAQTGQWKRYGTVTNGRRDEADVLDLEVTSWQAPTIGFRVIGDELGRRCEATLGAATIAGWCTSRQSGLSEAFTGERTEVLTFGLHPKSTEARARWQRSTRAALELLAMGGEANATELRVVSQGEPMAPLPVLLCLAQRDDELSAHPADYTRQELELDARYVNADGLLHLRRLHGWLLVPSSAAPPGGFPAVVAVNGHNSSALQMTNPDNEGYWYGESFARRGFVVFALDVSHRPLDQRTQLYTDYVGGDGPGDGNWNHPAITFEGQDSDWEEEGERAADALSARRFLVSQPFVDSARIGVMGLSMGGDVTTWAAALDPSFRFAIAAGYSPDTDVLRISGAHACFKWQHADSTQYLTTSDLHALVAPRVLVIETGARDATYSTTSTPFSQDVQVTRRSRTAWGPERGVGFLHYLTADFHRFHVGGVSSCAPVEVAGVTTPAQAGPSAEAPVSWQTNGTTQVVAEDLFAWLAAMP